MERSNKGRRCFDRNDFFSPNARNMLTNLLNIIFVGIIRKKKFQIFETRNSRCEVTDGQIGKRVGQNETNKTKEFVFLQFRGKIEKNRISCHSGIFTQNKIRGEFKKIG